MVKSEADSEHYLVMITKMYSDSYYLLTRFMATDITTISLLQCSIAAKSQHLIFLKMTFHAGVMKSNAIMICHTFLLQ